MAYFQSLGIVAVFIDISSIPARTGVMAFLPNFRISRGTPPGPTGLFLPIYANLFLQFQC